MSCRSRAGQTRAPKLEALLADRNVLKLFHFGRFDMATLSHAFGVMPEPVYCTKIASKLARTYTDRHGLKDLVRELLGVEISKQQQSSDWGADVLTEAQLAYAASDVLYLHGLREKFDAMLAREGRDRSRAPPSPTCPTASASTSPVSSRWTFFRTARRKAPGSTTAQPNGELFGQKPRLDLDPRRDHVERLAQRARRDHAARRQGYVALARGGDEVAERGDGIGDVVARQRARDLDAVGVNGEALRQRSLAVGRDNRAEYERVESAIVGRKAQPADRATIDIARPHEFEGDAGLRDRFARRKGRLVRQDVAAENMAISNSIVTGAAFGIGIASPSL